MRAIIRCFFLSTMLVTISLIATCQTSGGSVGTGKSFKGPIGLQLYSLREQFKTNVPGTLKEVQSWGVKYAELAGTYNLPPESFKSMLNEHGIEPIGAHFAFEKYRDDPESVATEAKALGLKYAGCAWVPHEGDFDEKLCRGTIAVFNKAGAVLAKHGIKFFYHVHGYEFQPYKDGTLLDLLIRETDPKLVSYEMDIFWVVFPNQDPVKLFQKYGKRWELVHLKDMRKGTKTGSLSGGTDVRNDAALGAGLMDMPAILKAAKKAGVKYYFIEDESPWSEQQIPQSLDYLERVRF
jgi:sugar phosphate isomerase/epimerase